ncbi:hypothetical protein OnM2_057055 [Erysiphe neolycopersici]|uniref:Uncharacterized protein n=1 Tax=Erysiphe neolycopersici TaxID=212602 RepID=A0A420HQS5_9PEZI|nr:hypothetical protein OnM2_057055 [Erysiphe neolycopersici]
MLLIILQNKSLMYLGVTIYGKNHLVCDISVEQEIRTIHIRIKLASISRFELSLLEHPSPSSSVNICPSRQSQSASLDSGRENISSIGGGASVITLISSSSSSSSAKIKNFFRYSLSSACVNKGGDSQNSSSWVFSHRGFSNS